MLIDKYSTTIDIKLDAGVYVFDNQSSTGKTRLYKELRECQKYGENVAALIDSEIKSIIDEAYENARKIITEHKEVLDQCATLLLAKEKVTREEFEELFNESVQNNEENLEV